MNNFATDAVFSSCLLFEAAPDLTRNRNLFNTRHNCGVSYPLRPDSGFSTGNHERN